MSTVIGVFDNESQAERAVNEIKQEGIGQNSISIVAPENSMQQQTTDQNLKSEQQRGQNLTDGAVTGGALGGLAGLVAGAGALTIPGIGPIIAAGPIAAGLSGVAAGGLAGSLVDLGIDENRGQYYEQQVQQGGILATIEASDNETDNIADYMRQNGARDVEVH